MRPATTTLTNNFQGFVPQPFPGTSAFEIHTLEWFLQHNKNTASRLRSYEIIWVKSGTGLLTVDHLDVETEAGTVYFLRPGQFRYLHPGQQADGYYLSVSPDFFHLSGPDAAMPFLQTGHRAFDGALMIQTDDEIRQEAEDILIKLRREFTQYANTRSGILKGLFRMFMLYLSQKMDDVSATASRGAEKELVNKFMDSLKLHYATKKMVADYADEFCVTPGHLNRIVKKISGFPVSYHIQQQIVLEAKRQARYSDRSMKEIAYSLGFEDLAHFSKFFKNNSGMNFSNFKRQSGVRS
jgi:AraC family transcriptional regulator, transcriptional activator of pobA